MELFRYETSFRGLELVRYEIFVRNATTTDAQTTMVVFGGLDIWTEYSVRVRGVNEAGPGVSTTVVARTPFDRK